MLEELKKEFGLFVFLELEDEAAWEDALEDGYAKVHPLWVDYQTTNHPLYQLKICRDYRKLAGY